jgi:hypothetical protein
MAAVDWEWDANGGRWMVQDTELACCCAIYPDCLLAGWSVSAEVGNGDCEIASRDSDQMA